MADELETIKRKIDIVELIGEYAALQKSGRNFKALCPFHSEKTPSFIVSPERQIWHCFGGCGIGGDIFGFIMRAENIEFGEALRLLAKRAGVKLTRYQPSESEKQKQLLYEINHLAAEFYHYVLLHHPAGKPGLDYFKKRGMSQDSLVKFKLGFAPQAWDSLQKFLTGKKGYPAQALEKAGLVIKGGRGFYDRFRGRVMFNLKDHRGNLCGFAGRVIAPDVKQAKYVNTPETLIYHKSDLLYGLSETKDEIKKADSVILVEGELDAISSYQAGVKNVVAIKGSAITPSQVERLAYFTKNLILALDADLAGDKAAHRGIEIADQAGMNLKVVEIKGGKDPDEVAQKKPKLWQKQVEQAVAVYDYFLDTAFARNNAQTAEGKRKIGQEIIPILAKVMDEIVRSHYSQLLAERLGVPLAAIAAEIEKVQKPPTTSSVSKNSWSTETSNRREILEEYLLALAFQAGQWSLLKKKKVLALVKIPRFVKILKILVQYLKRYHKPNSQRLAKMLPAELKASFDRFYLLSLTDLVQDKDKFDREWQKTFGLLEQVALKEELTRAEAGIKALEKEGHLTKIQMAQLDKLDEGFRNLSQKIVK